MKIKFFVMGLFVAVFLILTTTVEWTPKVNAQGDYSMNTNESKGTVSNLAPQQTDTTSEGIGASIPSSTPQQNDTTSEGIGASIPSSTPQQNDTTSEGIGASIPSSTPQQNDTTSEGIGASIPSSTTIGNVSSRANTTA
jgi:hypothetical protein